MSSSEDDTPLVTSKNAGESIPNFALVHAPRLSPSHAPTVLIEFLRRDPSHLSNFSSTSAPPPHPIWRKFYQFSDRSTWLTTILLQRSQTSAFPRRMSRRWTPKSLTTTTSSLASLSAWGQSTRRTRWMLMRQRPTASAKHAAALRTANRTRMRAAQKKTTSLWYVVRRSIMSVAKY
jgi:hypothetical protein